MKRVNDFGESPEPLVHLEAEAKAEHRRGVVVEFKSFDVLLRNLDLATEELLRVVFDLVGEDPFHSLPADEGDGEAGQPQNQVGILNVNVQDKVVVSMADAQPRLVRVEVELGTSEAVAFPIRAWNDPLDDVIGNNLDGSTAFRHSVKTDVHLIQNHEEKKLHAIYSFGSKKTD